MSPAHRSPIVQLDRRHVWHPFTQEQTAPDPIEIVAGRGAVLTAADGREYLDLVSSWWVNLHGHAEPRIAAAIAEQATRLEQVIFAGHTHPPAATLAGRLAALLPGELNRVFFSDDGSTAVEVALKQAAQFWLNQGQRRARFLAFEGGYHGDTAGAMSVGRGSGFFDAFADMLFSVQTLPYPATWEGDEQVEAKEQAALAALDSYLAEHAAETAALIMEPLVQGAGGMRMCRPAFVRALAERLRAAGVLLIFDEIMTGFGRTGELFACLGCGVTPDMICLSKGLTGGFLPMSVTVCTDTLYAGFLGEDFDRALVHGHSYTANPLACAAALASLEITTAAETRRRWAEIEALHRQRLAALGTRAEVAATRVQGTIGALDVVTADGGYNSEVGPRLKRSFAEQGLLLRPLGNVVYLLPPYCTTDEQLHRGWDGVERALDQMA